MRCASFYRSYNFKNVKNAHGGVLLLVKLLTKASNFIKINFPPWVFYTFFKLYKCNKSCHESFLKEDPSMVVKFKNF